MIPQSIKNLFARAKIAPAAGTEESKTALAFDPLDRVQRTAHEDWKEEKRELTFRSAKDFPVHDGFAGENAARVGKMVADAALKIEGAYIGDDDGTGMLKQSPNQYTVPEGLFSWYMSQGFIGYQACAIIAQHWLVDKACSMSGEDAVRNGWVLKSRGGDDLSDEDHKDIIEADKEFKLKENLVELNRFKNVFGIRVAIFQVQSDDPLYYEKPFNIDGIKEGSYKGISQVDPYWMMPVMTSKGTSDPADKDFYDPEYWVISGRKYHKTHLVIVRGPQPADILKPTYIFGGVPLTQRIYERVYAAERTANEAPLMAMSKRTMAIHADLEKVMADQQAFERRLMTWLRYRDNHGVKVLGKEEAMEQFDINMSDFDSIIMNQYQLVSSISRTPATKLLGTSPKGFNATGEHEIKTYNQELESVQEHTMMPLLTRHYDIQTRNLGLSCEVEVVCNEVDSITTQERAELNEKKSNIGIALINAGVISPDEERERIRDDEHSGYNRLGNEDANETPGMSPENIAALQKGEGAANKGEAALQTSGAGGEEGGQGHVEPEDDSATNTIGSAGGASRGTLQALIPVLAQQLLAGGTNQGGDPVMSALSLALVAMMAQNSNAANENALSDLDRMTPPIQGTKPRVRGVQPGVGGIHHVVSEVQKNIARGTSHGPGENPGEAAEAKQARDAEGRQFGLQEPVRSLTDPFPVGDEAALDWNPRVLPKVRVHGLTCMIENPRNSVRKGISADGKPWAVRMANHYGFIKGYEGADGDEVDCFLGPNLRSQDVYVVQQKDMDGAFDEHKCMLGFDSEEEARTAYATNFKPDWDGLDCVQRMSVDDFKEWLDAGSAAKPLTFRK